MSGFNRAGVNAEESQLSNERIVLKFEGQRGKRLLVIERAENFLARFRIGAMTGGMSSGEGSSRRRRREPAERLCFSAPNRNKQARS